MPAASIRPRRSIYYGWWIAAAGAVSQVYVTGTFFMGFGAFFDPIVNHFGWSRAITSGAVSLQRAETGIFSPFVGLFIDRFGPRKVMLGGIVLTGLGFIFLSRVNSIWQFYGAFTLITIGLSFGAFLVTVTTVANWFVEQRGRAIAVMSMGAGLGGLLVPIVVWLIAVTDWRSSLLIIGVGFWIMGVPVSMVMRSRPEDYGYLPDGRYPGSVSFSEVDQSKSQTASSTIGEIEIGVRDALKTRVFWQMAVAMGSGQLIMAAQVHQIPAMTSFGAGKETAGLIIMGVSLISLIGRLGSGILGDRMDKRRIIALSFVFQFIGTLIFAYSTNIWHLMMFMVLWGVGMGGSLPLRFALVADYFGRRSFGSIMGVMMTVTTVFGVAGPVFTGWMFDLRGNYRDPYLILSFTLLVSIPLILSLTQPTRRQRLFG